MTDIVISIKPVHMKKIIALEKNHEFRKYIPKKGVDRIWIYTTSPICTLEYMAEIDYIVSYPDKIKIDGVGNEDFNKGLKNANNAYHIKNLYKLDKSITLNELRAKYNFTAPQSYFYLDSNEKLKKSLEGIGLEKIN